MHWQKKCCGDFLYISTCGSNISIKGVAKHNYALALVKGLLTFTHLGSPTLKKYNYGIQPSEIYL